MQCLSVAVDRLVVFAEAVVQQHMGRATAEALDALMDSRGATATEIVGRVISLLAFIEAERQKGSRLALLSDTENGQQVREIILGVD
jgi:hypothetical protein